MTRPTARLTGAALLALALGACSGGTMTAEEATTQACDTLAASADSVATLVEGAAADVETIRDAGTELRDRVGELSDELQEAVGSAEAEAIVAFIVAQRAYRQAFSTVEQGATLEEAADDLSAAGAELQTRFDEVNAALGCG